MALPTNGALQCPSCCDPCAAYYYAPTLVITFSGITFGCGCTSGQDFSAPTLNSSFILTNYSPGMGAIYRGTAVNAEEIKTYQFGNCTGTMTAAYGNIIIAITACSSGQVTVSAAGSFGGSEVYFYGTGYLSAPIANASLCSDPTGFGQNGTATIII